jgi:transcriptional regulator with PAS, ATPase and Fis domain
LQEDLLQNELFGHEKGAFTGAIALKRGLFEVADTGTMFLDEIAEMTPGLQARLLRVIETGTFRRVGGVKDIHVDVRIIAATNQDLKEACSRGAFREDLYYRLNVFTIMIPPLRERPDDIPVLARHFIGNGLSRRGGGKQLAPEALDLLKQYPWPGNVRELKNVIERALILAEGDRIEARHLPGNLVGPLAPSAASGPGQPLTLEEAERLHIARLLAENAGNRAKVAAILDVSERNLYRKIKRYAL